MNPTKKSRDSVGNAGIRFLHDLRDVQDAMFVSDLHVIKMRLEPEQMLT